MARAFQEALNKDGPIAKGGLGFRHGAFKRVLELGLLAHNTHTTATTTHGSLDDDWNAC